MRPPTSRTGLNIWLTASSAGKRSHTDSSIFINSFFFSFPPSFFHLSHTQTYASFSFFSTVFGFSRAGFPLMASRLARSKSRTQPTLTLYPTLKTILTAIPLSSGKVTILFANTKDEDGNVVDWVRGTYSEKLLCDLSPFFGAIFNSDNNWLEARTRMIHFDDITIHDFNRLYSLMKVGGHSAVGDRDSEYVMSRLLRTHQLAERFLMPVVKLWVRRAMQAVIRSHKNWPAQYREQVVDKRLLSSDSIQRAAYHARKLIDMVGVYMHVKNNIPRHRRPLRLEDFIVFFVECVPHGLMMPVILRGELEEDFLREYLWQKLFRMDEIEGNALESL